MWSTPTSAVRRVVDEAVLTKLLRPFGQLEGLRDEQRAGSSDPDADAPEVAWLEGADGPHLVVDAGALDTRDLACGPPAMSRQASGAAPCRVGERRRNQQVDLPSRMLPDAGLPALREARGSHHLVDVRGLIERRHERQIGILREERHPGDDVLGVKVDGVGSDEDDVLDVAARASSASRSTRRDATITGSGASPGILVPFHPLDERLGLARCPSRRGEEVRADLAQRGVRRRLSGPCPLEGDL
jgi:hypothetical protein